jgi:hypothetical protein
MKVQEFVLPVGGPKPPRHKFWLSVSLPRHAKNMAYLLPWSHVLKLPSKLIAHYPTTFKNYCGSLRISCQKKYHVHCCNTPPFTKRCKWKFQFSRDITTSSELNIGNGIYLYIFFFSLQWHIKVDWITSIYKIITFVLII